MTRVLTPHHLLSLLFPLGLISKGADGRGKEVLLVRYKNAVENMRNIFLVDGQVMIVSCYSKTQAVTDQEKVIPRFLPLRIAQLVVAYLETVPAVLDLLDPSHLPSKLKSILWTDRKGVWDTNRATRALALETSTRLGVRLTFQDYRHVAKLIDREHVRTTKEQRYEDDQDDNDEEDSRDADAHDLAYGHQITTADGVYGIDASMLRSLSDRTMRAFRSVAEKWHRFLGLSSIQSPVVQVLRRSLSTACIAPDPTSPSPAKRRQGGDAEEEMRRALTQLLGSHADFRSHEQEQALLDIHRGTSPLVVVLPTGGGKSLCFQLAASMASSSSVTIVVVPFTALLKSLQQRCRLLVLACVQWTVEKPQSASVTLVGAETTTCDSFFTFASGLQSCGRLRAIFLDECHVAITVCAYRSKLAELDQLRKIPCQYVPYG
jgi:hypothetical protein